MARPWRDIISMKGWQEAVMARSSQTAAQLGSVGKLRGVFDSSKSVDGYLKKIGNAIALYHDIDKTDSLNADTRVAHLERISQLARGYLTTFNISEETAAQRAVQRSRFSGVFENSNIREESVDRNVLTLSRRALRKAKYIRELKAYYNFGGAGAIAALSKRDFLDRIHAPQVRTDTTIGLVSHTRMEQADFAHRGDFEVEDEGSCGRAFAEWAALPAVTSPFFWWLEGHDVCRMDDKQSTSSRSVQYARADQSSGHTEFNMLRQVSLTNPAMMYDLSQARSGGTLGTTAQYTTAQQKDPRWGGFGQGVAAYVWTVGEELFIANHAEQRFHHSSFVSGQAVKCAGMIVIENGIVTALSNNSGHYKPRKQHLFNFVLKLTQTQTISPNCQIQAMLGMADNFRGKPAHFMRNINNLEAIAVRHGQQLTAYREAHRGKSPPASFFDPVPLIGTHR